MSSTSASGCVRARRSRIVSASSNDAESYSAFASWSEEPDWACAPARPSVRHTSHTKSHPGLTLFFEVHRHARRFIRRYQESLPSFPELRVTEYHFVLADRKLDVGKRCLAHLTAVDPGFGPGQRVQVHDAVRWIDLKRGACPCGNMYDTRRLKAQPLV